jgi:hypothetical protein
MDQETDAMQGIVHGVMAGAMLWALMIYIALIL